MVFRQRFLWKIVILMLLFVVYSLFNLKKIDKTNNIDYDKHIYALIANKDLYPGYIIKQSDISWRQVILRKAPKNVISSNSKFGKNIQGMKVANIIHKNNYILKHNLKVVPHGSELSAGIKKGMIAINLVIKNDYISSKIKPGDKINLILTRDFDNGVIVNEILSNVKIIDVSTIPIQKVKLDDLKKSKNSKNNKNINKSKTKKNNKTKSIELILEVPQKMSTILSEVIHEGFFTISVSSKRDNNNPYIANSIKTIIHIKGNDHSMSKSIVIKEGS